MKLQFVLLEGLGKKGLPWHGHQCRGSSWPWLDGTWEMMGQSSPLWMQIQSHHHHCHLPHSLGGDSSLLLSLLAAMDFQSWVCQCMASCAHCETVKTVNTNEAQVVVHSLQMFTTVPSFWPSFPHHRQKVRLFHCHRASGKRMPSSPLFSVTPWVLWS